MENIDIEKLTVNNCSELQRIAKQTFLETFSESNTQENMQKYLAESFSTEKLSVELNNENSEFYFAKIEKQIVGYLKLNSGISQTEIKTNNSLEIERIYVLQDFQGKKVGQILYNKAIEIAIQENVDFVWLGVWRENKRAISFYKKNGFEEFDKHVFKFGDKEQTDIMMKLILNN
ncbi:GNAT family acetyltransferase [Chryseobacterium angstadtii]|uniref:GNAT family acetyltransferase n=1 Tax=Chryseobacterium angstadtii TaxID=558151 RepID=A0A0J7IDY9_9FLAO|nr:GNAT family N-acetyltransferase [Chryseobacterium angstadtii]KMQ64658.1 GNAT family acetyltransferase [Chryseobacterium angstadtii]